MACVDIAEYFQRSLRQNSILIQINFQKILKRKINIFHKFSLQVIYFQLSVVQISSY